MKTSNLLKVILALFLITGMIACSDSSSDSGEEGQPPSLPKLEYTQPDLSYFNPAMSKIAAKTSANNYALAQSLVMGFSSFTNIGQIYTGFLTSAQSQNASFNDGVWEWEYDYNYTEMSFSTRLTAKETSGKINWNLFISADNGELNFDNYNMMSGWTQNDGKQGEWTFNSFLESGSKDTPLLKSGWLVSSDTEQTNDIKIYNENGVVASIHFERNGNEYRMLINNEESDTDIEVFWNDSADLGYVLQDGKKSCWQGHGANTSDVACGEVGL